jgi:hypothetical protein
MHDVFVTKPRAKRKVYTFACPVCRKLFRSDESGEPCCTGPSESRDEHPMEVMHLHSIQEAEVNPTLAERRAQGPLILPGYLEELRDCVREQDMPKLILP